MKKAKKRVHKPIKRPMLTLTFLIIMFSLIAFFSRRAADNIRVERSLQSFCNVYSEEDSRLESLPGDSYPSGVFNEEISDASEFAVSFDRLEKAAPEEIRADVATLQSLYAKIHEDPSQAIAASLSGIEPEENVEEYIDANCGENS